MNTKIPPHLKNFRFFIGKTNNRTKQKKYITVKSFSPEPSLFLGPRSLRVAKRGKYITEKDTSLNIVAPVPL